MPIDTSVFKYYYLELRFSALSEDLIHEKDFTIFKNQVLRFDWYKYERRFVVIIRW